MVGTGKYRPYGPVIELGLAGWGLPGVDPRPPRLGSRSLRAAGGLLQESLESGRRAPHLGPIRRLSEPGRPADGRHVRILEVWTAFFVASDRQRISRLSLERRGGPRQNTRASAQNWNLIRFV